MTVTYIQAVNFTLLKSLKCAKMPVMKIWTTAVGVVQKRDEYEENKISKENSEKTGI